jgi:hypothetical protein
MKCRPGGWILIGMLLTAMSAVSFAQVATTLVADTVYHADGTAATGTVLISWPAFTTSAGQAIVTGSTSATISAAGALSVALTPNSGAVPIGTYYTAVFHLDDGTVTREYWVVPVSASPVTLSAIESTVLPTTIAMQTVTKTYVDTAIAAAVAGAPLSASTPYVLKGGDTLTGPLNLSGDPTASTQAADKNYVDNTVSGIVGGLGQKVSTLPTGSQAVTQPTGSQLAVNTLNGVQYASQNVTGNGNNGIVNTFTGPGCMSGCDIKIDRSYASGENFWPGSLLNGTHVTDARGGTQAESFLNPLAPNSGGLSSGERLDMISTLDTTSLVQQTSTSTPSSVGLAINHEALSGGSNMLPGSIETPPYFKMAYSAMTVNGNYNTQGQHGLMPQAINCYGVGDCLLGSRYITASGGTRDEADEGAHLYDTEVREDYRVFQGTCLTGCAPGATSLGVRQDAAGGTQGDGRFLIDKNPTKTISSASTGGTIVGGAGVSPHVGVQFSGTNFPLSVFLSTANTILSQAANMAPGNVSVPIATSGVPTGYATSTAAIGSSSGVACVSDLGGSYYEMAPYTVVDGTHLRMTLLKPHKASATLAFGGLCGYGIEQTADTQFGIRQVFPVIGSYSPTGLYYEGLSTPVLGQMNQTGAFVSVNVGIGSVTRAGGVVTVALAQAPQYDVSGLTVTIAGVSDSSYNGQFVVTTTGPATLTYAQSGPDSTASGGSLTYLNGAFVLYPMAEVLSVLNPATRSVDGQLTLAPNTVAWAANDPVEEPHFFTENIWADVDFYAQTMPRPTAYTRAGLQYGGNNSGSMFGWSIQNVTPSSNYFGYGGTHTVPTAAYESLGAWQHNMQMTAGEQSAFTLYCNAHGCGNWNSGYDLFQLQDSTGFGYMHFAPQTSNLSVTLRGSTYTFAPQGFTAGTINATTLNAGVINGSVSAASVNTGTLPATVLPLFGGSGASHAPGAVPDPGGTPGSSRYLREDGNWAAPSGGSGGGCTSNCVFSGQVTSGSFVATGGANPWPSLSFPGAFDSNNGSADSGGWRGYYSSNQNIGFNVSNLGVPTTCTTAEILRFVKDYGEQGGAVLGGIDRNSNVCGWNGFLMPAGGVVTWNGDTGVSRAAAGGVAIGNGAAGDASGTLSAGTISAALYKGPATAPTGACSAVGWVFSQDGHASFCNGSSWVQKF